MERAEVNMKSVKAKSVESRSEERTVSGLVGTQDEAEEAEFVLKRVSSGPITKRSGPLEQLTYLHEELSDKLIG